MDTELAKARQRLIEALGRQSAFWGMGKITGELYAVLYLSEDPLSLGQLADELGVTKGNVSIAIRLLEQMAMVRRSMRPGDRRVFFAAEIDFWAIAQRVLERRQKPEFDESFRLVAEGLERARGAAPSAEQDFFLGRMQRLQGFYSELDQIVAAVLLVGPKRLTRLVSVVTRMERFRNRNPRPQAPPD